MCKLVSHHRCQEISANLLWSWVTNLCICLKERCTLCTVCCIGYGIYSTYAVLVWLCCVQLAHCGHTGRQNTNVGWISGSQGGPSWGCSLLSFILLSSLFQGAGKTPREDYCDDCSSIAHIHARQSEVFSVKLFPNSSKASVLGILGKTNNPKPF